MNFQQIAQETGVSIYLDTDISLFLVNSIFLVNIILLSFYIYLFIKNNSISTIPGISFYASTPCIISISGKNEFYY